MKHTSLLSSVLLGALSALITGCASPAKPQAMVPKEFSITRKHPHSVSVSAEGGKKAAPTRFSQVSNEDFIKALTESLEKSGVFSQVIQSGTADNRLEVWIINLDQPGWATAGITAAMSTQWRLVRLSDNQEVFSDAVRKEFRATMGDALAGVKRVRLASEGAARENIKEGIRLLSELKL